MSWNVTNSTQVKLNGSVVAPSDSQIVTPSATTTHTLEATNSCRTNSQSQTVTVLTPETTSLTATPATISPGQDSLLEWSSYSGATGATLNGNSVALISSQQVWPATTTDYTLNVTGPCQISRTTRVTISGSPVISQFSASSSQLCAAGSQSTLLWTSQNGTSATINGQSVDTSGSMNVYPTATTIYTLIVSGAGQPASQSVTITVHTPETTSLTATPATISPGQDSLLEWTSYSGATAATLNGNSVALSSSQRFWLTTTTDYTLNVTGPCAISRSARVTVDASPIIINFRASATQVCAGGPSILSWTSQNGTAATINGGAVDTSAEMTVHPLTTTTYTLIVSGSGQPAQASIIVSVDPSPVIATFTASSNPICSGQSTILNWGTTNATSVKLNGDVVAANDNRTVSPTSTTTYTLEAINSCGTTSQPLEVAIVSASLTAEPTTIAPGQCSTVSWNSYSGATGATLNGNPVPLFSTQSVCPSATKQYVFNVTGGCSISKTVVVTVTSSPVIPAFYRYSVRHEKGTPPFFPIMQVQQEAVNSANGNLFFTVPLVSRPGRAGMGVDLKLAYNSKIWEPFGDYMTIAEKDSWVGTGWTLLVGRLIDDSVNGHYYITLSDGSNHDLTNSNGVWRSMDSTYMVYDPVALRLTLKGGMSLVLDYFDPQNTSMRYATRVQDANGNYIDINYVGTGGRISNIHDTLGNTYQFHLNSETNRLDHIHYPDTYGTDQTIQFRYSPLSLNFGTGGTADPGLPTQYALYQVSYPNSLKFGFTYGTSGEIAQITYPSCGVSRYFYSDKQVYDKVLQETVTEHFVTSHETGQGGTWTWTGDVPPNQAAPPAVQIALPGGINVSHVMGQSSFGWADGFLRMTSESGSPGKESEQHWEQDDDNLPTIKNPRLQWHKKVLKGYGGPDQSTKTVYSYALASDNSGNVKEILEYGFNQAVRRRTTLDYLHETYSAYAGLNITDRVTQTLVYDGNPGTLVAKTVTGYDAPGLVAAPNAIRHASSRGTLWLTRGLPTTVTRWYDLQGDLSITSTTTYDECGNPTAVTDPLGYRTETAYWSPASGDSYAFPLQVWNHLDHVTSATYSYTSGAVLTRTDANNRTTSMSYDLWDRMVVATKDTGWRKEYSYPFASCPSTPPSVTVKQNITSSDTRESTSQLDPYGRPGAEIFTDPVGGNVTKTTSYDPLGRIQSASVPHRVSQSPNFNQYSYNGGNLASVTLAEGGTIQYAYNANIRTVTNTDGNSRWYTYQEDGKVSEVHEVDPNTGYDVSTNYSYDPFGRLRTIEQGVQTRTFVYDNLGRLTSETHPESGTTSYTYDKNSNVLTKRDARNITTYFTYDPLNRLLLKSYSDDTPSVSYSYDNQPVDSPIAIANPIGRLTMVTTTTSGVTVSNYYSYCDCSSVERESAKITDNGGPPKTYTIGYGYNLAGEATSITYPDGKVVYYTRDTVGRETKVSTTVASQNVDLVRSTEYLGPQGGLSRIEFGIKYGQGLSYVQTNIIYSSTTLRMTHYMTFGLASFFNYTVPGTYPEKQTGHIYDIADGYNSDNSKHYEYDQWYRLTGYWVSNGRDDPRSWRMNWTYDRYGNLTSRTTWDPLNLEHGFTFNNDTNTNRLMQIVGQSFTYDAAGNRTSVGEFDAENRLKSAGGVSYRYDGHSRRLSKEENGHKIYYVYSITGRLMVEDNWTHSTSRNQIYFNGQLLASHDSADNVRILFKDHLGSTRSVVTVSPGGDWATNWETTEVYDYHPFGEPTVGLVDPDDVGERFTGKKRDGNGLDYFGARYYDDGSTGGYYKPSPRWISADSVTAHIYDPESLNKYAYVRNDPVNIIDRDGRLLRALDCYDDSDWGGWFSPQYSTLCSWIDFGLIAVGGFGRNVFPLCGGGTRGFVRFQTEVADISIHVTIAQGLVGLDSNCAKAVNYLISALHRTNLLTNADETATSLANRLHPITTVSPCGDVDGPTRSHLGTYTEGGIVWVYPQSIASPTLYATLLHEGLHLASGESTEAHNILIGAIDDPKRPSDLTGPTGRYTALDSTKITDFIAANCKLKS